MLNLSNVTYVVLDEADRMLDMGFEKDIREIFTYLSKKRHTAMFSATWPISIRALAAEYLTQPIRINIGSEDLSANTKITQIVEVIEPKLREKRLLELLRKYFVIKTKILVFALYKYEAKNLSQYLTRGGYKNVAIHGDLSVPQRKEALEQFKSGNISIMVATDVAARGLDIEKVEYVINYSFPLTIEDYVHRIGRTGRAGGTGISHTLFQREFDKAHSGELIGVLRRANMPVPENLLACGTSVKKKEPKLGKINLNTSNRISLSDSDDD